MTNTGAYVIGLALSDVVSLASLLFYVLIYKLYVILTAKCTPVFVFRVPTVLRTFVEQENIAREILIHPRRFDWMDQHEKTCDIVVETGGSHIQVCISPIIHDLHLLNLHTCLHLVLGL